MNSGPRRPRRPLPPQIWPGGATPIPDPFSTSRLKEEVAVSEKPVLSNQQSGHPQELVSAVRSIFSLPQRHAQMRKTPRGSLRDLLCNDDRCAESARYGKRAPLREAQKNHATRGIRPVGQVLGIC